jgi:prevent-host-death family protein
LCFERMTKRCPEAPFCARELNEFAECDKVVNITTYLGAVAMKAVSAADANRNFSQLLQGVRRGRIYVVTSHGKPVARLTPVAENGEMEAGARAALLKRLRKQRAVRVGSWTRDELYEDAQ